MASLLRLKRLDACGRSTEFVEARNMKRLRNDAYCGDEELSPEGSLIQRWDGKPGRLQFSWLLVLVLVVCMVFVWHQLMSGDAEAHSSVMQEQRARGTVVSSGAVAGDAKRAMSESSTAKASTGNINLRPTSSPIDTLSTEAIQRGPEDLIRNLMPEKGPTLRPKRISLLLDVVHLGAIGDGRTDNSKVFNEAISRIRLAGGGTVHVPAGIFRVAPLELTSDMILFLARGSVLKAIDDPRLWKVVEPIESYGFGREGHARQRHVAFLFGDHLHHVTITGDGGCIDGSGGRWWKAKADGVHWDGVTLPHLIELQHSNAIEISRVRLIDSPMWTVHPFACTDVIIRDVEILNPVDAHNTDGIDPDSCENVLIENVVYTGGDDGIALKSGWDCFGDERGFNRPTKNVVIRNFTVLATRAAAVAIGSEMSGGVSDVLIEGLRVEKAGAGGALCIKTTAARGGYVRNVVLRGVAMGEISGPPGQIAGIMVVGRLGDWVPEPNPACRSKPRKLPEISGLLVEDIHQLPGTRVHGPALILEGLREGQILRNVVLERVQLDALEAVQCSRADVTVKGLVSFFKSRGSESTHWQRGRGCNVSGTESDVKAAR